MADTKLLLDEIKKVYDELAECQKSLDGYTAEEYINEIEDWVKALGECQQELEQANQQIEILSRAHVDVVEKNIALADALKMVEWVDDEYGMWCPWCEAGPFGLRQSLKHHDNCPRQAALAMNKE